MKKVVQFLVVIVLCLIGVHGFGQNIFLDLMPVETRGQLAYENQAWMKALEYYEQLDPNMVSRNGRLRMAEIYRQLNDPENASIWYDRYLFNEDLADPVKKWHYLQSLLAIGNYKKAQEWLLESGLYFAQKRLPGTIEDHISSLYSDTAYFQIRRLDEINSEHSDYAPAFCENDLVFVTSREKHSLIKYKNDRDHELFSDLFLSKINDGFFEKPEPLSNTLNRKFNEGPAIFLDEGKTMYYSANSKSIKGVNRIKIFKSTYSKRKLRWGSIKEQDLRARNYSSAHPALTKNGERIYFTSDRPGGHGGTDLYYADWVNGKWSVPSNAGDIINSFGDEMFPFVYKDSLLIFSSDGHPGLGGMDIFAFNLNTGHLFNLGYPVNTHYDDFSLILTQDGRKGYFSSNREKKPNDDDLYELNIDLGIHGIEQRLLTLKGAITDKDTKIALNDVQLIFKYDQKTDTLYTSYNGVFFHGITPNVEYSINISKDGFLSRSVNVGFDNFTRGNLKFDFELSKLEVGKFFTLENVHFDAETYYITHDLSMALDKLSEVLLSNPGIKVEIGSHTDSMKDDDFNLDLSQKRAESAVTYLIYKGIDKDRIIAKGYGESKPLNHCANNVDCTDEELRINRRLEYKILETGED